MEEGYLPEDAGHDEARSLIKRSMTAPQYTPEGTERMAESDAQARYDDAMTPEEAIGDAVAEIEALEDNEFDALLDAAIPWDEPYNTSTEDAMRALGFTDQEIQDAIANESAEPQSSGQSSSGPDESAARQTQGIDPSGSPAPRKADEGLTGYTPKDVTDRLEKLEQAEKDRQAADNKADADAKKERERKDIASRQNASAENFELGQDADDSLSGQGSMFSRPATDPEVNALKALKENDEIFSLARSDKDTVEGIAADTDVDIKVKKERDPVGRVVYTLTMPDGKTATISVRPFNKYATQEAPTLYGYNLKDGEMTGLVTERPGNNAEDVGAKDDVWVDVSHLKQGGAGARIYNIAETFAHNTGRIFIGDPAGLSDAAVRRRTEQMLSSALKFGTTRHLAPHPRQVAGAPELGVPPLDWTYGDDIGNIRALIHTSTESYNDVNPLTFEPSTGRFLDSEGNELDRSAIRQIAESGPWRAAGAGSTTLQRGAIFNALVREEGGEGGRAGRRAGLLEGLVAAALQHGASTKGLFYSRSGSSTGGGNTGDSVRKALTERFGPLVGKMEARGIIKIWDNTQQFNKEAKRSEQITGVAQGLWNGKTAHLFADGIQQGDEIGVFLHEVGEHASMQKMLGTDKYKSLLARALLGL